MQNAERTGSAGTNHRDISIAHRDGDVGFREQYIHAGEKARIGAWCFGIWSFRGEVGVAASLGFEPRQRDPESLVLPLHYEARVRREVRN